MKVLKRSELKRPQLNRETVESPELGGAVIVRGMTLTERLIISQTDGERQSFGAIAEALSWCVLLEDGEPAFTREEWEAFGAAHIDAAVRLFIKAKSLSGMIAEDLEKKS